jgi:hypothetical protein
MVDFSNTAANVEIGRRAANAYWLRSRLIPYGVYIVQAIDSDVVEIDGNFVLSLTFEIMDGQFATRTLVDHLNIKHTNEKKQAIALRAMADLFLATETPPSKDSDDLHFKPCLARVDAKGKIRDYKLLAYRSRAEQFIADAGLGDEYRAYLKLAA